MTAILEIAGLSKSFPGTRALHEVDLDIEPGEVHALVGQNGSGKSTLIKLLAGFHSPEDGARVRVAGDEVRLGSATAARAAGFRFVHQDLALVGTLNVVENLALTSGFVTGFGGRIRWAEERERARTMLASLGFDDIDVRRPVADLTAAQRTVVAIARALWDSDDSARILVLDEPTATLPRAEVEHLFAAIQGVQRRGIGVLYVSHRLDEVFSIASRVTVLRDGLKVGTFDTATLDENKLISLMLGTAVLRAVGGAGGRQGECVLVARDICGSVLAGIDFEAYAGEVVGFAGLTGSGREELLPMLFGAMPRSGTVTVRGYQIRSGHSRDAITAGVSLVPADRLRQGGIFDMSLAKNMTLTDLRPVSRRFGAISRRSERGEVMEWLTRLDVRPPNPDLKLATLSGGNQQKIVIAKWLRRKPKVLLLDELTQGVDVGAKAAIHTLVRAAASEGATVILASSDDEEICDLCDRVYVLRDGVITAELEQESLSADELGRLQLSAAGLAPRHEYREEIGADHC
jgi:ribose transport system ATP-binding protein